MDNIIIIGSGVIVLLMIIGAFIVLKDQTAPIGNPNAKKRPGQIPTSHRSESGAAVGAPSVAGTLRDPDGSPINLEEVKTHIRNKRKIEAIKELRELTGLGLTEAKQFVDQLEQELREFRG